MILCIGDTVPSTTEKSRILRKIIIFIILIQIIIAFGKLYYDLWNGVAEFLAIFVLWCAQAQLNYCNCVIYIFFCMMNSFVILVYFATDVQNRVVVQNLGFQERYYLHLSVVSLTFYIVAIYFTFQAYKEFKGIAYDVLAATSTEHMALSKSNVNVGNVIVPFNGIKTEFPPYKQNVSQYLPNRGQFEMSQNI